MRKPTWNGAELPATDLTYGQLAAGRQVWSDSKFFRSSEDPEKRHYFIQGSTPSAVSSLADIPAEKAVGFVSLPCLGARGMIAGWYSTVDDALRDREKRKILKLYEAALSMPMRLRLGPSRVQVSLDSISYSEDLFAAKTVVSDSFFDFAQKLIGVFPIEPAFGGLSGKMMKDHADKLGIRYHGNKIGDTLVRGLQNLAPFVQNAQVQEAFKAFEDVSFALNDQTKISMLMHTTTKHFGRGKAAGVAACVQLLKALRLSLLYKDIAKDSHLTKEFLIGGRNKAPFIFNIFISFFIFRFWFF